MDETEKMTALKKAYAEIILNTAKEAAARIIVSERRAHSFQRDLSETKDEALHILIRIKQMIDMKMNEAETKSLIQQKRIGELEAQLHEAEDIVSNLRAELYGTQAQLERLSRNQQRTLDDSIDPEETAKPDVTKEEQSNLKSFGSSVVTPLQPQHVTEPKNSVTFKNGHDRDCYGEHCYPGDSGKTDVTSIIIRSTDPELYRNGCTQRIRACDRNLLNGHLSLSKESDVRKCEKIVEADKGGNGIGVVVPAFGEEAAQNEKYNPTHGQEIMNDIKAFSRLKRKRALRRKRNGSQREVEITLVKPPPKTPDVSLTAGCTSGSTNSSIKETNNDSKKNQEPGSEGKLALTKPPVATAFETENVSVAVTDKDTELAYALVLITQESVSRNCTRIPASKEEQEIPASPLVKSNSQMSDLSDAIPIQSPKDRIVKYTFQRKRKRESANNDDVNTSP